MDETATGDGSVAATEDGPAARSTRADADENGVRGAFDGGTETAVTGRP